MVENNKIVITHQQQEQQLADIQKQIEEQLLWTEYLPDVIQYEPGAFSAEELIKLRELGHHLKKLDNTYGNMQLVIWNKKDNLVSAASDRRGEGEAIVK